MSERGKIDDGGAALKIRLRDRRGYSREAGGYTGWSEYQLVRGRKIIGRYETLKAAEAALIAASKSEVDHG